MIPSRIPYFMKDTESPTIESRVLADIYRQFNSKGWECLVLSSISKGKPNIKGFRFGCKYTIIPRTGKYSIKEIQDFIEKHKVIPKLRIIKPEIPIIYPSDWGAGDNEVTYGKFEEGDEVPFCGIEFRNSYARLHGVGDIIVREKPIRLPNEQIIFDYSVFPELIEGLNNITSLLNLNNLQILN